MNILSCFDGISCGQLALERANIKIDNYWASEVDKKAIAVTQYHYPNTIQLGDIQNWNTWDIDFSTIDLLIGGSPCFTQNTKVFTETGYKNINAIQVHEKVLTHKNRFKQVLKTGGKISNIYCLKIKGLPDTFVTANHPFYIKENRDAQPIWKKAKDLLPTDYLIMHNYNSISSNKNISQKILKEYKKWLYILKEYSSHFSDSHFVYFHFEHLENCFTEEMVYNLEVEEDNSYIANNMIVHNCQGFSFRGKQLNFNDPRSKLFFEYYNILKHIQSVNPNVKFLLENVKMKKDYILTFNKMLKTEPIEINSSKLSAQKRKRLFWTNIENVEQPEDLYITLYDVIDMSLPIEITFEELFNKKPREKWYYVSKRLKEFRDKYGYYPQFFNPYNLQDLKDKALTLTTSCGQPTKTSGCIIVLPTGIRNITIQELEQLQTLPVNYTLANNISKTSRCSLVGNGWTVDVVAHIFKQLEEV